MGAGERSCHCKVQPVSNEVSEAPFCPRIDPASSTLPVPSRTRRDRPDTSLSPSHIDRGLFSYTPDWLQAPAGASRPLLESLPMRCESVPQELSSPPGEL